MPFGFRKPEFNKFWAVKDDEEKDDDMIEEGDDTEDDDEESMAVYVNGPIYSNRQKQGFFDPAVEQTVGSEFKKELARYPDAKTVKVFINSPGGEVFAALGMMNALLDSGKRVVTYNNGIVGSAATLIFAAGDKRVARQGGVFFYHNVIGAVRGNKKQIMQGVELMDKITEEVIAIYEATSKLDRSEIKTLMNRETTLTSREALDKGFATTLQSLKKEKTKSVIQAAMDLCKGSGLEFAMSMYDSLNDELELYESSFSDTTPSIGGSKTEKGENQMDYTAFFNSLSPEQQALIIAEMAKNTAPLQAELTAAKGTIAQLQAQVATATTPADPKLSVDAITADLSPEAKAQVESLLKVAQEQQAQLLAIQEEQKYTKFTSDLAELSALPLDEATIKALYAVANSSPENYAQVKALLKVADQAMATQFKPVGNNQGSPVGGSAFAKMEAAIALKQKDNPNLSYADAMKAVTAEQPDLWDQYREEISG